MTAVKISIFAIQASLDVIGFLGPECPTFGFRIQGLGFRVQGCIPGGVLGVSGGLSK